MASIAPRRASYHCETVRRASVKNVFTNRAIRHDKLEQQYQQQPSPQAPKPIELVDDNGDNNQEEDDDIGVIEYADTHGPRGDDVIRPASLVLSTSNADQTQHQLQHVLEQAPAIREPPLVAASLRQENAALKLKLVQLGNQHDIEIQAMKVHLKETASTHLHVEESLKKQIHELEKRQLEAVENAHKYQAHVEVLQKMLHALESQAKGFASPRTPSKPLQPPTAQSNTPVYMSTAPPPRRGNGSPLPYGNGNPFTRRSVDISNTSTLPVPPRRGQYARHKATSSTNLLPTSTPVVQPAYQIKARCIPVPIPIAQVDSLPSTLSPPLATTKDQQQRVHHAVLLKKTSNSLLSYCTDMLSSKLAVPSPLTAALKPNMKVTPVWSRAEDSTAVSEEDYTAITIL